MDRKILVDQLFMNDLNCSQVVFSLFSEELGLDKDTALKIATGFGSGMRKGEVCGAVSGAIMVIGLKYGHYLKGDTDSKSKTYDLTSEFEKRFEERYRSIRCKEILGYDVTNEEDMIAIREQDLFKRICPEVIKEAISILEEIL